MLQLSVAASGRRYTYKTWFGKDVRWVSLCLFCLAQKHCATTKDKDFNLFAFPQEPIHPINAVGNPLILSSFVTDEGYETAKNLSRVSNYILNESAAQDIESYSGFFTVEKSELFFWFFPAEHDSKNKPLIVWLQVIFEISIQA